MKRIKRFPNWELVRLVAAFYISLSPAAAEVFEEVGPTYPVKEPPLPDVINDRMEKGEDYISAETPDLDLPRATETTTRTFDPSFNLPYDLRGEKGEVLFQRGLRVNPLQYRKWPPLVAIDGSDVAQVEWLAKNPVLKEPRMRFVITGGDLASVSRRLRELIFRLPPQLAARFDIQKVPSIVRQKGDLFEITEIRVD